MVRTLISIFLIVSVFMTQSDETNKFQRYASTVPILSPPIVFDCLKETRFPDHLGGDTSLLNKFCPKYVDKYCRVFPKERFVSLIYTIASDDGTPTIYTYTKEGKAIDTLYFFLGGCQSDYDFSQHSVGYLYPNKMIHLVDTLQEFKRDTLDNIIPESIIITVRTVSYQLDANGYFQKTK